MLRFGIQTPQKNADPNCGGAFEISNSNLNLPEGTPPPLDLAWPVTAPIITGAEKLRCAGARRWLPDISSLRPSLPPLLRPEPGPVSASPEFQGVA